MDNDKLMFFIVSFVLVIIVLNWLGQVIDSRYTILPQDITNLGRNTMYSMDSYYKSLNGIEHNVNPRPYEDQPIDKAPHPAEFIMDPPNAQRSYKYVDGQISRMR
tara:strand:- start:445 stop:759 length:315 start_codon:yes stop_codon:yes gene_type:complete